jgi:hypothetical protein
MISAGPRLCVHLPVAFARSGYCYGVVRSVVRTWLEIADRAGVLDGTKALRNDVELLSERFDRFRKSVLRFEEDLSKRMAQEDDESAKELAASRSRGEEEEYSLAAVATPSPASTILRGETRGMVGVECGRAVSHCR